MPMRLPFVLWLGPILILGPWPGVLEPPPAPFEKLLVSKPIACTRIDGYRTYTPLERAALTKDEKLLVYLEVANPTIHASQEEEQEKVNLHLTQEIRVRKSGERKPLWIKHGLQGLEVQGKSELGPVYLDVVVGIKGLRPGQYDLDIIVHDRLARARSTLVTLPFEVLKSTVAE